MPLSNATRDNSNAVNSTENNYIQIEQNILAALSLPEWAQRNYLFTPNSF